MKKLLRYLKKYKKEVILGPVFKLTEAVFELIVPLVMANVIDVGIKNADADYVVRMGIVMIVLCATGLLCALICQYFASKASQGFGTELRNHLFSHIGSLSHAELDKIGTPSLITRITNDTTQLQVAVAMFIRLASRAPFLIIGATVMAFTIDYQMAFIFLIAAVGIAIVLYLIMTKSTRFYDVVQKLLDKVSLLARETLGGARVIRAFSRQKAEQAEFRQVSDEQRDVSMHVGKLAALLNPLTFLIVNFGIIAILWFGGSGVDEGMLEQGQIVALVNYMMQILLALIVVANLVVLFTKAGASARRVNEVLEQQPSIRDGEGAVVKKGSEIPAVEFQNVSFAYTTEDELIEINLKMMRGQTIGVIGGTGAGKTTLVDLIPRFYDTTRGSVLVDGEDVRKYNLKELRGKIGMVPQRAALFAGTLRQNMLWGREKATDAEIWQALEVAQAAEFVKKWPDGLDARIAQDGRNLSGGQRQRLTIARALVGQPEILILDDSSSALDFMTDAKLRKALAAHDEKMTVIVVSQRASSLKHADKIVVLDDGALSGVGTHDQLFETNELYREICLSQMDRREVAG